MKDIRTLFTIVLMILPVLACSQTIPDTTWTRTFPGWASGNEGAVKQTADGGYIVLGQTSVPGNGVCQMRLIKTNAIGDAIWSGTYGIEEYCRVGSVVETPDHGFVIAGNTQSSYAALSDWYIVRTDSQGDTIWTRTIGTALFDLSYSVCLAHGGGYVVSGSLGAYSTLVKLNDAGGTVWTQAYGPDGSSDPTIYGAFEVVSNTAGGYYVAGRSGNPMYALKTDGDGNEIWYRAASGGGAYGIAENLDTGCTITGDGYGYFVGTRFEPDGDQVWTQTYSGFYSQGFCVLANDDGSFLFAGNSNGTPLVVLADQDGVAQESMSLDWLSGGHSLCDGQMTSDGGYIFITNNSTARTDNSEIVLIKLGGDDILPVEVASLDAIATSNGIRIQFETASESDIDHFEIMRSMGASEEFSPIGLLNSRGNSSTGQHYEYLDSDVTSGNTYWYYLANVDIDGSRSEHRDLMVAATALGAAAVPQEYSMTAYPNPFNPTTTITFSLPESENVRLAVYDLQGRLVRELTSASYESGSHQMTFDADGLPSGTYLARLDYGSQSMTEKLLLLK